MPCKLNHLVNAAAYACKAKAEKNMVNDTQQLALDISNDTSSGLGQGVDIGLDPPLESEICSWVGLKHDSSDVEKKNHRNSDSEEDGFLDLEGDELLQSLQKAQEKDLERLGNVSKPTPFDKISQNPTLEEWKRTESNQHLGYSKGSMKTLCCQSLKLVRRKRRIL